MSYTPANPYCSVEELLDELKRPRTDAGEGSPLREELQRNIEAASRLVDTYKGRDYYFHDHATTAFTLDGGSGVFDDRAWLPYKPVITLGEVTLAGTVLVLNTDFYLDGSVLVRMNGSPWGLSRPSALLTVKGTFGYTQASSGDVPTGLPANISRGTCLIAAALSGHLRVQTVGLDGEPVAVTDRSIPKSVWDLLGKRNQLYL